MDLNNRFARLQFLLMIAANCTISTTKQTTKELQSLYRISIMSTGEQLSLQLIGNSCKHNSTWADCSGLNFQSVPDDLSIDLTYLDLSNNKIYKLENMLARYSRLQYLNLKQNQLHQLSDENFSNLTQLTYLNLAGNNITMDNTFPRLVFLPVASLQALIMNHNHPDLTAPGLQYPDQALSVLGNLVTLYIDGLLNQTLGQGFRNLTSLKKLALVGPKGNRCRPVFVRNDTFSNVPQLESLNLTGCCIEGKQMEHGVFDPLTKLKVLDLSRNKQQCLDDLNHVMRSLNNTNVTYLGLANLLNPYLPCVHVSKSFIENLPVNLKTLVASSNSFEVIGGNALSFLPKNLTELDISDNRFTFGSYLKNFSQLENLQKLYLNGGTLTFDLPKDFPDYKSSSCTGVQEFHFEANCNTCSEQKSLLKLPPNLEHVSIEFAGWSYSLTKFNIDAENSLTYLSLNGNNIVKLVGPVLGLVHLKEFHLVKCNILTISETFFETFSSLETLNLSSNFIGEQTLSSISNPVFKSLVNLRNLDLSFNNILTISFRAFEGLHNLEKLWLHNNGFYYFNVNITHMTRLAFIDFRFTEMSLLNASIIDDLNKLNVSNLIVDFAETPIHCFCSNLHFLEWIVNSPIFHHDLTHYKCVFMDTSEKYMDSFDEIYHSLLKECEPEFQLFVIILLATLAVLGVAFVAILYRFRWKLKYLYYSAYIRLKKIEDAKTENDQFEFDVFTSYVHEDHEFVVETLLPQLRSRGLKVHIHSLHFVAGAYISTNIVDAIQKSRHTLVVLTHELLNSKWCKFELQMANMHSLHIGRPVLVFLLMDDFTKKELDVDLLYHIQNNTYVKYPNYGVCESEHQMDIFWSKLATDLQS